MGERNTSQAGGPLPGESARGARARQREGTRERLYECALAEFREVGFAQAQIDRIARAARVVRGTFYFHFPTKEDVLLELAFRTNARIASRVAALGQTRLALRELLVAVNACIMEEQERIGEAGLLREILSLYVRRPGALAERRADDQPSVVEELTRQLQGVADREGLRTEMPMEQLAVVFFTSLSGMVTRFESEAELRLASEALIDLLVRGMQAGG